MKKSIFAKIIFVMAAAVSVATAAVTMAACNKGDMTLNNLRNKMDNTSYEFAIAYIGYAEENTIDAVKKSLSDLGGDYLKKYAFLNGIGDENTVIAKGCDIYCIVPKNASASVTVNAVYYDEEGLEILGDVLYSGDGSPILLLCNVSDIMTNSLITITDNDNVLKFSPYISLRDGSLAVSGADEDSVYDFSK